MKQPQIGGTEWIVLGLGVDDSAFFLCSVRLGAALLRKRATQFKRKGGQLALSCEDNTSLGLLAPAVKRLGAMTCASQNGAIDPLHLHIPVAGTPESFICV